MAIQQPWTIHEAVILLDGYLQVLSGNKEKKQAISDVSNKLRQMAKNNSIPIDDVYRNYNGITFQMASMESAFRERTVMKPATKLFAETVNMYKTNFPQYRKILEEAIEMCSSNKANTEVYVNWLATKVNTDTLSKLYLLYDDIGKFMQRNRIVSEPILHITDIPLLKKVQRTVEQNKLFRITHKSNLYFCGLAMRYYLQFLSETAPNEHTNTVTGTTLESIPISTSTPKPEDSPTTANKAYSDYIIQVLDESGISYVDHRDNLGCLWALGDNSILPIITKLKSLNASFHYKPEGSRATKGKPAWWTKSYIPCPQEIDRLDNTSVTPDTSAQNDIATDPSAISLWNFDQSKEDPSFREMRPVRLEYFGEEYPCEDWDSLYIQALKCLQEDYPTIIRGMVGVTFTSASRIVLSETATLDKLEKAILISDGLYADVAFQVFDFVLILRTLMSKCNMDYENLVVHYVEAANYESEEAEIDSGNASGSSPEPEFREGQTPAKHSQNANCAFGKDGFEDWMINGVGLAVRSAQSYSSAVNTAGQFAVRFAFSEKELFFISDPEQVYQISMKLLAHPEFADMNNNQHNRYSAALSKYWDYCNAISGKATVSTPIKVTPVQDGEIKENRVAFIAWAQAQQMQHAAILAYLTEIKKCSEFARQHNYIQEEHFILIKDVNALERAFAEMKKDSRFIKLNNERYKRPVSAMNKLIAFRRATANSTVVTSVTTQHPVKPVEKTTPKSGRPVATPTVDPQVRERYTAVLAENFVDGFRPAKAIDRNRFRMYYSDMFGEELSEEDEQLVRTLMNVGTLRDERIFVKDEIEQKDLLEDINDTIMETLTAGASCVYLDCLFTKFQDQLAEMLHIYNVDSLESVLFGSKKRNYFKRYNYLFGCNKEPAPARDVIEYMKSSHLPVTYSEIENGLWYIPLDKIKHTLVTTPGIVNVASEAYLYAPNLPVSEREIQQITELISQALLQRSYISDVELMQLIEDHCPSVLMNTPDYPMWGLRNALAYLLGEKFSFRGAIISDKDEELSMAEVFSDFCQRSKHLTVDELRNFASELNTVIYWDSVYGEMVRINQNEFLHRDQIHFNIEQTDAILDSLIQNAYTPIKTINLFLHFPAIDVPWNKFVLESYVANYSKKFRLLHASYTAADCCGAVVRQESGISDYRALIVDVLSKNTGWKTKIDALQLLVDLGYQQRKAYSDIEKVMQEAAARMSASKK